jgi:integrase
MMAKEKNPNRPYPGVFRKGTSKNWIIDYYRADGRRVKESTGTDNLTKAREMLRAKLAAKDRGEVVSSKQLRVEDLYKAFYDHVEANKEERSSRALAELKYRWAHLLPVFGHRRAATITTADANRYRIARKAEGCSDSTASRELSCLRTAFNFAVKSRAINVAPYIPIPKEYNARQGFLEDEEFDKLAAAARDLWLRTLLEIAYAYGWRRHEIVSLRVGQLDFGEKTIKLEKTKNGDKRLVPMTPRVEELLRASAEGKGPEDCVLTRMPKAPQPGRKSKRKTPAKPVPITDLRKAWAKLFSDAGVRPRLLHDFRRAAARQMRNNGTSETVIMKTTGHRTTEMFRRYSIVDLADQRKAMRDKEAAREEARRARESVRGADDGPVTGPFEEENKLPVQ